MHPARPPIPHERPITCPLWYPYPMPVAIANTTDVRITLCNLSFILSSTGAVVPRMRPIPIPARMPILEYSGGIPKWVAAAAITDRTPNRIPPTLVFTTFPSDNELFPVGGTSDLYYFRNIVEYNTGQTFSDFVAMSANQRRDWHYSRFYAAAPPASPREVPLEEMPVRLPMKPSILPDRVASTHNQRSA